MSHGGTQNIIWVVEDNEADAFLMQKTLGAIAPDFEVRHFINGQHAWDHLEGLSLQDFPRLVLLDVNLPVLAGKDLLKLIRKDERTCMIPVIMISSSDRRKDVQDCYRLCANAYLVKHRSLKKMKENLFRLVEFWLRSVSLPL